MLIIAPGWGELGGGGGGFFNMKVCCVFSLALPHLGGDSNEYTQYTIFTIFN